ncbi:UDP-glucose 4-epimerase [Minicystis rosea]|nr:UDP-glucose 4-epimerase [Minicystis rosea]
MSEHILITGGAGFIGSHLADALLHEGHRVRVLDNLTTQVHGPGRHRPAHLSPEVELVVGDVRDPDAVRRALSGIDAVYHFAAMVGVGQSMYQIESYTSVNVLGTSVLLEAIAAQRVRRIVVASSMSLYGEGLYRAPTGAIVEGKGRSIEQLRRGEWELRSSDDEVLEPVPTPETKTPALESVYALSKYDQERLCLIFGRAYAVPVVAMRFFNVYGPRQALSNPYTGVLAIFASRLLNDAPPLVYEDGLQRRDFVSVHDVARACVRALSAEAAAFSVINVGSGNAYTVREIAAHVGRALGSSIAPEITGKHRVGDVRHCFADIGLSRRLLGHEPQVTLEDGLEELAGWLAGQAAHDRAIEARAELEKRGLTL